ncbi:STAS domain-containing protein [Streptomyces sp. JNUCC 64]
MDRGTVGSAYRDRLRVDVRRHGTSAVVTPAGELDHHTAELLQEPLDTFFDEGAARVVVDCSRLEFCDSTGLNVLLGARLRAEAAGGGVHLAGMLPTVARVFEITGAEAVFTVHATLDDALDTVSGDDPGTGADGTADGTPGDRAAVRE